MVIIIKNNGYDLFTNFKIKPLAASFDFIVRSFFKKNINSNRLMENLQITIIS
jgi:hypothetical protein